MAERTRDIVAVAHEDQRSALKLAKHLMQREEIGQGLTGMVIIGKAVDDGHAGRLGEDLHRLMGVKRAEPPHRRIRSSSGRNHRSSRGRQGRLLRRKETGLRRRDGPSPTESSPGSATMASRKPAPTPFRSARRGDGPASAPPSGARPRRTKRGFPRGTIHTDQSNGACEIRTRDGFPKRTTISFRTGGVPDQCLFQDRATFFKLGIGQVQRGQ